MYLTRNKLLQLGLGKVGKNVFISDKCSIYGAPNIFIGDNVRIDDFCILSAGKEIWIGDYVHIGCQSVLIGRDLIELHDFSGVSMQCAVLSSSDDYSGRFLTNPLIPEKYLNTHHAPVVLEKFAVVGAHSVVLPGVCVAEGSAVGACSFVNRSIPEYEIWAGSPARYVKNRSADLLKLEKQLRHG